MFIDRFHKQALDLRGSKSFFCKGVKLDFGQNLCQRCDTFNSCATGDKVVRPLAPIAFFVVGDTVFNLLFFVLELRELAFIFRYLSALCGGNNLLSADRPRRKV